MMVKSAKRIGEILLEKGFISEAQLHDALLEQKISDKFLGMILIDRGFITDHDLLEALSEQFNMPLVDIKEQHIDMELARKFSTSLILDHKFFPLKEDDYSVTVAIINPLNAVAISKIQEEANPKNVNLVLVDEKDLEKVIQNYRQYISQSIQRLLKRKPGESSQ
jgi:hypothetical protein